MQYGPFYDRSTAGTFTQLKSEVFTGVRYNRSIKVSHPKRAFFKCPNPRSKPLVQRPIALLDMLTKAPSELEHIDRFFADHLS
jgi:hypothetical protein